MRPQILCFAVIDWLKNREHLEDALSPSIVLYLGVFFLAYASTDTLTLVVETDLTANAVHFPNEEELVKPNCLHGLMNDRWSQHF